MQEKKSKLKLRKWVIISVPLAFLIAVFTMFLIFNNKKAFVSETVAKEVKESNILKDNGPSNQPGILSQNSFVKGLSTNIQKRKIDYTIVFYANKFKLNINKVLEIAHSLTNNYDDPQYKQTYVIAPDNLKASFGPYKNIEAGIVEFVREVYRYPENYGSSLEEIRVSEEITTFRNYENNHILLDSGLTFEQFLAKVCDLYGVDKTLALAIVYQESGRMSSALFTQSNNISGQRGYAGWLRYPTLEAGVIGFVVSLNNMIENYQMDMSRPDGILNLSSVYVNGHIGNPSQDWTNKVTYFMTEITDNKVFE